MDKGIIMKLKKLAVVGLGILSTFVTMHSANAALEVVDTSYFVRPALRVGAGELIDGADINGATSGYLDQSVVGYSSSSVDLTQGTVKMFASEEISFQGLQTFGSFGERITITNGAGTNWDVGFAVEGMLELVSDGAMAPGAQAGSLFYDVGIAVYRAGQVTYNNFVNNPDYDPVLFEYTQFVDDLYGDVEYDQYNVFADAFGSVELTSNYEEFDIFAYTNVIVLGDLASGVESYTADFLNTARFSQTFATGVQAYSSSGQFMNLNAPPPNPNSVNSPGVLALCGLGFGLMLMRVSGKRQ